jgi:hypothetical protein
MKTKFTNQLWISLVAVVILAATSCKKDLTSDNLALPDKPVITSVGNKNGIDTVTIGKSITLHPTLASKSGAIYNWSINGTQKGTDSVFTYTPDTRGDVVVNLSVTNTGGNTSASYRLHVYGKYENGFFIANEGWYGHGTGSLSFYRYDTGLKEDSLTTKENPGLDLSPATSTVEYSTIFNNKLYLLTKVRGPLVVMDPYSLKESGRVPAASTSDWRAFVGIDNTHALVSSQTGVYPLNLTTLAVGDKLTAVTGQIGDMIKAGNYIFVLSSSKGVQILNASDYSLVKTISGMLVAFTQTPDGSVWTAGGTSLLKINPTTLDVTTITVPFTVYGSWAAWHPGSIAASTKENAIFLAKNASFSGGTSVYKYIDGNATSLQTPFVTIATGKELYGAGIGYNPANNQLVVTTVQSGFGTNFAINDLNFYDAATGALKKDLAYSGYYFPAILVFH